MLLQNLVGGLGENDTPRPIQSILKKTYLSDVQNLWSDAGILKSQAGQEILAQLPDDFQIKHVSRTNQNSRYIYIIGENGDVFIYNRTVGLKRYKTLLGFDVSNLLTAQYNNNLVLAQQGSSGNINIFGGFYESATSSIISENVNFNRSGNIVELQLTPENLDYVWRDKLVSFERREGAVIGRTPTRGKDLKVSFNNKTPYDDYNLNGVNILGAPDFSANELSISSTARSGVSYPDFISPANGQRWCIQCKMGMPTTGVLFQISVNGAVSSLQVSRQVTNRITVSMSSNGTSNDLASEAQSDAVFTNDNEFYYVRLRFTGTQYLLDYSLDYDINTKIGTWVNAWTLDSTTSVYFQNVYPLIFGQNIINTSDLFEKHIDDIEVCYDEDHIPVYTGDTGVYSGTVFSYTKNISDDNYTVRLKLDTDNILTGTYNLCERALISKTITYTQEGMSARTPIINQLFIAQNRLYIEDISSYIYYSQVGVFDNFNASTGAGFIYNFYNDNSRLIDIEEFTLGVIITRGNGLYRLNFRNTVEIELLSNISSTVQGEHIAVNDKILGFDNTSKSIVEILKFNFLGALTAGKTLINSDSLIGNFPNILADKKCFSYNSEYNICVLYLGEHLNEAILLREDGTLWKRTYNDFNHSIRFINGDIIIITEDGFIKRDFDRNSVMLNVSPYLEIEPISGGVSSMIHSKLFEVFEYTDSIQSITAINDAYDTYSNDGFIDEFGLPDLVYSDNLSTVNSFADTSKWANNNVVKTRVALNGSGINPLSIRIEFKKNLPVNIYGINLVDFGVRTL